MKHKLMVAIGLLLMRVVALADITVSDVQVFSGYPWKDVAIGYTIVGEAGTNQWLRVRAKDHETGKTYECKFLDGVAVRPLKFEWKRLTEGRHVTIWNTYESGEKLKFNSTNVVVTVEITDDSVSYISRK